MTRAAAEAGKHVFCEKPLATSLPEASAAIEAADRARRQAHGRLRHALEPAVLADPATPGGCGGPTIEPVLGGSGGSPSKTSPVTSGLPADHWFWDRATSGGIFIEHGVHFFDAASWLFGDPPITVAAVQAARTSGEIDTVVASTVHPGGATADLRTFVRPPGCRRVPVRPARLGLRTRHVARMDPGRSRAGHLDRRGRRVRHRGRRRRPRTRPGRSGRAPLRHGTHRSRDHADRGRGARPGTAEAKSARSPAASGFGATLGGEEAKAHVFRRIRAGRLCRSRRRDTDRAATDGLRPSKPVRAWRPRSRPRRRPTRVACRSSTSCTQQESCDVPIDQIPPTSRPIDALPVLVTAMLALSSLIAMPVAGRADTADEPCPPRLPRRHASRRRSRPVTRPIAWRTSRVSRSSGSTPNQTAAGAFGASVAGRINPATNTWGQGSLRHGRPSARRGRVHPPLAAVR